MLDPTTISEGETGSLLCLTNIIDCCKSNGTGESMDLGQWYFPSGADVPNSDVNNHYTTRGPSLVRLNRQFTATTQSGLYLCEIPVTNGTENIYIGLYLSEQGESHLYPGTGNLMLGNRWIREMSLLYGREESVLE